MVKERWVTRVKKSKERWREEKSKERWREGRTGGEMEMVKD